MVLLKTPVLEKPHLAGFFLEVGGHDLTEFFNALFPGQGIPIRRGFLESNLDSRVGNAALREVQANAHRTLALVYAGLNEAIGEPLIALQAVGGKLSDRLFCNIAVEAFVSQLPDQLGLAVFAACQKVHGFFPRFKGRRKTIFPLIGEKIADFFV